MKALKLVAVLLAMLIVSLPVAFATETSLIYDRNGNLLTDGSVYRIYNALNQLVEIRNGTNVTAPLLEDYFHHPVEERIFIKRVYNSSGSVIEKVIYHDKNFVTVINSSGTFNFTYVYHEGVLVAQNTPSGKEFIHPDHKGSVNFVTNDAGTPIENTTFDGFGNIIAGGESTRFDYEGKEFSSVVGDFDFGFRKYSPSLGIFTQPDTLIPEIFNPQTLNRYSFERNNPYKHVDPDGHNALFVYSFAFGFAYGAVTYGLNHIGEGRGGVRNFATYMGKGLSYATVTGAASTASVAVAVQGPTVAAASFLVGVEQSGISVAEYVILQKIEGEDITSKGIIWAAISPLVNPLKFIKGLGPKAGTFYGTKNAFTTNNVKFYIDYLAGQMFNYLPTGFSYVSDKVKEADESSEVGPEKKNHGGGSTSSTNPEGRCGVNMSCERKKDASNPRSECGVTMSCEDK